MTKKLKERYRKNENRHTFEDSEYQYNNLLTEKFGTFEKHKDDPEFYTAVFKKLDLFFNNNSKIFSQLKHLSYDLADLLTKAGKTIHRISALYNMHIKDSLQTYAKVRFKADEEVDLVFKKLKLGLNEWGSQMITQSRYVIDNLASFFHFKKHENATFSKLFEAKMEFGAVFKKNWDDLEKTKKKLFDGKNTEKWKINYNDLDGDFNEMFKDFNLIKPYMLPDVN